VAARGHLAQIQVTSRALDCTSDKRGYVRCAMESTLAACGLAWKRAGIRLISSRTLRSRLNKPFPDGRCAFDAEPNPFRLILLEVKLAHAERPGVLGDGPNCLI
jgi:hypothetical protein